MKKYWLEILVFVLIGGVLLNNTLPAITWMNTDSDGAHYILAAKYLTTAHHMSAPLYLLIGHLFLKLPFGTDAWRMGLISMLSSLATAVFIYLVVKQLLKDNLKARWYALISSLVYGGSALVISQSTIIETYTLATMCGVLAYYLVLKQRWIWASVVLGSGLAIHPFLAFIVWAVLFVAYKEMRHWRRYGLTILFFAFYLYIPIVARVNPNMDMWGNETAGGFMGGTMGMVFMLTGGLAVWDLPKRLLDTVLILGVSFGLGIVPLVWYFIKGKRGHLFWLVFIPVLYFAINLANEVYVYMIVAIAFGSIVIGLGLSRMNVRWLLATAIVAVGVFGFNSQYFDIGRNLDPEMSAVKFYNDLDKIPDGEYFMGGGWTWAMVYLYNREEGRDIIPISIDALPDKTYWRMLDRMGINYDKYLLPFDSDTSYITRQGKMSLSIARMNEGVWIAKETKPEVYQYSIEPAKGNEAYLGRWIGQEVQPEWKWRPSNPYLYISGQLEVAEWHHVLWVRNPTGLGQMLFVIVFGIYGYGVYFLLMRLWKKRRSR